MARRIAALVLALLVAAPATAAAQIVPPEPIPIPPPWPPPVSEAVVVEDYRLDVTIDNQVATVTVTEILRNDGRRDAEAVFLHPIPADAAITSLTLWIDGEPVAAEVLPAGEARQIYEEIVAWMRDPALLEFADQGLVRASVYPVPPGGERRVELQYTQILEAGDGLVRFTHPLGREIAGVVEHFSAHLAITAPDDLLAVYSPSHTVAIERPEPNHAMVTYESGDEVPSSDLLLYYSTGDDTIGVNLVTYRDPGSDDPDGVFLLLISPRIEVDPDDIVPKDVVVVVDTSGSMEGDKIGQARGAARYVLGHLNEDDRFGLIAFDSSLDTYAARLRPASDAGDAIDWVDGLAAGGATDIQRALLEAFGLIDGDDGERPAYVLFLTDGLPTEGEIDTPDILAATADAAPDRASVFAFGVGWDVDTILLDGLAEQHHGTTTYVTPDEQVDEAVSGLYARVSMPVLTGVGLDVDGVTLFDVFPGPLPDLFAGEQLVVMGRYREGGPADVTLTGEVRGGHVSYTYSDLIFERDGGTNTLPRLWATRKIGHLLRQVRLHGADDETIGQIVDLSIRYGIVTPYTSFLVTEPAPFGAEARERIADEAAAATTTVPASGEAAVEAADAAGSMAETQVAPVPDAEYADLVAVAGSRTFRFTEGVWIDTAFDPNRMDPIEVPFLSDAYFALAAADPGVSASLAVGDRVTVVWNGLAYEIVGEDEAGETFELPGGDALTGRAFDAVLSGITSLAGRDA